MMKLSTVIQTQTFTDNTKYQDSDKYRFTDVYGVCDFPHFLTRQHADTIQEHHATMP